MARLALALHSLVQAVTCYDTSYRSAVSQQANPRRVAVVARLPEPVERLLPAAALEDVASVLPLWKALRQCYPTEEAAIVALRLSPAVRHFRICLGERHCRHTAHQPSACAVVLALGLLRQQDQGLVRSDRRIVW